MLRVYGKIHAPTPKQCKCSQGSKDEHYQESPKGTGHWNKIKWSGNSPKSPEASTSRVSHTTFVTRGPYSLCGVTGNDIVEQQEALRNTEWLRSILLSEPRGRYGMNAAIILPPTCPCTVQGILFMRSDSCKPTHDSYPPISVTGLMCATKVMLEYETEEEYGIGEEEWSVNWDTVAGPVKAFGIVKTSKTESWCAAVNIENVPSFVLELDYKVACPAIGTVTVDIAFGGVFCAFVDASSLGLKIELDDVRKMAELGQHIKEAIDASYVCSHPDLPFLKQVSSVVFTEQVFVKDGMKLIPMATVVSPGRLDRSPSGTATSARLAILHKRGEIRKEDFEEDLKSMSLAGGSFAAAINGRTKVGEHDAVLTRIGGTAWTTSMKQVGIEGNDRFVEGFRLNDLWSGSVCYDSDEDPVGLGIQYLGRSLKRWPDCNDMLGETY